MKIPTAWAAVAVLAIAACGAAPEDRQEAATSQGLMSTPLEGDEALASEGDAYDTAHACDNLAQKQCGGDCNLKVGNDYCPSRCRWRPAKTVAGCTCWHDVKLGDPPCKPIPKSPPVSAR